MTNSVLKTLALSLAVVSAAGSSFASEPKRTASLPDATASSRSPLEIEIGWQRIESNVARTAGETQAKGAIIVPPFENFAPYRTDLPPAVAATWEAATEVKGVTTQSRPGAHD